jgi:EmrB/QacA subfamily drug resistance transporter
MSDQAPTQRDPRLRLLIPLVVAFAFFLEQLDSTIIVTAIPDMARGLGETPLRLNLALTGYILSQAVFIPASGWIADRYGMRRTFCAAIIIFTLGSIACGAATSFAMLVGARVLQGFGGAMMTPVGRLILLRSFPRSELASAISYMNIPSVIGPTLGPLAGGFIASYADWRWIFYVNVPFGVLGAVLAYRYVRDVPTERPPPFDIRGFLMLALGMLLLQVALEGLGHKMLPAAAVVLMFAGAFGVLGGYAAYARGRPNAALDLTQLRVRSFRVALLVGGTSRIGMNAVPFLLPLMLQVGFGLSAMQSGSLTFVMSLGTLVARAVTVKSLRLLGFDRLLLGNTLLCALGIAGFALLGPAVPHAMIIGYVLLFGMIRNTQFNTLQTLTYADIPAAGLSRATSLGGGIQQLTMGVGIAIAAALLSLVAGSERVLPVEDFHTVFLLAALFPLLALPGFMTLTAHDGAQVSGHRRGAK